MKAVHAVVALLVAGGAALAGREAYQRSGPMPPRPESFDSLDPLVRERIEEALGAVSRRRRSLDLWMRLGSVYEANSLFGDAGVCYGTVVARHPQNAKALHRLACVQERCGDLESAVRTMTRAAAADPSVSASWIRLAWWSLDLGDDNQAHIALERAGAARNPAVRLGLVRLDLAEGRPEAAARRLAEDGLLQGEDAPYANHLLVLALRASGDLEGAEAAQARSAGKRFALDDPWAQEVRREETGYAAVRLRAGRDVAARRFAQAEPRLLQLLEHDPRDTNSLDLMAVCRAEQGDSNAALAFLERLFSIVPDHENGSIHYARALLQTGRAEQGPLSLAVERLGRTLERRPDDPALWRLAAALAEARKDPAGVLTSLDRVVALDPTATDMRLRAAHAALELHHFDEARTRFRAVQEVDPSRDEAWFGETLALLQAGRREEARALLETLTARPGIDPERLEALRRQL